MFVMQSHTLPHTQLVLKYLREASCVWVQQWASEEISEQLKPLPFKEIAVTHTVTPY